MKLKRITPEKIAEYGVVNAPDKLVGNPHDNKMIFDRLIREVVAGAINALIDQWGEMDEAEDKRDEAEEQREAAEQARQEAENMRQNTFREEIEEAKRHEEGAYRAMDQAAENAHWSEAFAVGRENGVDIDSTNPAYRNNAKFYAEQARNVVGGDDVFVCPNILVSAADWSASTKYDDFPWEATAQVKDINGQHVPFVVFDHVDAATYGLATVADTADESLTIYSVTMPERDILIPVTVFMSEGAIQSAWKALSGGKEGEVLAKQSGKDHDFKWMPISGLGAGLDGERGLAIYRANKPWSEWTSEYFSFADFVLPADYKPKQNDLVLTSNNYLCWIYEVNAVTDTFLVASFSPPANLNGGTGPAGSAGKDGEKGEPGDTPYIGANGNWWIGDEDTGVAATGGGSGGASVQADLSENNETAPSFVKGRTHWKEKVAGEVLLAEQSITSTSDQFSFSGYIEGYTSEKCEVVWGGVAYDCAFQNISGRITVGNPKLGGLTGYQDNGEPFYLIFGPNIGFKAKEQPGTITFEILRPSTYVYHTIDENYLPESAKPEKIVEAVLERLPAAEEASF